jgi:glycosyltransferase involved in cell wall biosynthesis
VTSDFYHAEKRWFAKSEIQEGKKNAPYKLTVMGCIGYMSNISARRVISNIILSLRFFLYLLPRLNKHTVLIIPSRPVEMIAAAALLRLLKGTSVLLDIQDIWPDMLVINNRFKRALFTWYCNLYLYPSLRHIDKFIHTAPSFVNWLHRYAPDADSTFIPLGFDVKRWENKKKEDNMVASDAQIRLVYVGLLQYQIDMMPLLQAISGHSSFYLTLIGDSGDGQNYNEVVNFIQKHNMQNVKIVGRVPPEEMGEYLQGMDIGVVPMISNSIPNKVFDYIACGLPILAFGDNDIAALINEKGIGWNVPFSQNKILDVLDSLSKEEVLKKKKR